ncbi:hypothetical protein FIU93_22985 [Labrenzia sp. THAF35]|uniref:DUF669 domain-containing protein n=1 Tax=Labrenzia sp. THAF35 TaxID=2587854 RepID=UPI00126796F4|nr:DUF669 domain-containing protein [Labrenzia sp. THAF35]QFT69668.1 hypothetical protein FIU93_22985 [Labrenzia sp. THAF35]
MAKLGRTFDAQDHDTEQQEYQKLPLGIYDLEMVASEVDEKDTGDIVLKGTLEVLAPEDFAGRKVFLNFNLQHSSAKAQEIGQQEFARLCRAIGETTVDDSEELHFKRFRAKIGIGKDSKEKNQDGTPKWPGREEIKKYFFPDTDEMPEVEILAPAAQQGGKPAERSSRQAETRQTSREDDRQEQRQQQTQKKRPWGK